MKKRFKIMPVNCNLVGETTAVIMNDAADIADRLLEHAVRRRIGDHERGESLGVLTGANRGGKSTFLRSVGSTQLMLQAGMFVPAIGFRANLCDGLFTHFKREEDPSMKSGKLDEELGRMGALVAQVKPSSMFLFNESFTATNEREGSEIATQIVTALLEHNCSEFFVTPLV